MQSTTSLQKHVSPKLQPQIWTKVSKHVVCFQLVKYCFQSIPEKLDSFFSPHLRTISSKLGVFCLSWNHRHLATIDLDCEWAPRRHSLDMCHSKWLASTNVFLQNIHIELFCGSSWTGGHFPGCDVKSQSVLTRLAGSLLLFLTLLFLLQEEAFLHDTAMYQSDSIYSAPLRTKCYSKTLEWCRQR